MDELDEISLKSETQRITSFLNYVRIGLIVTCMVSCVVLSLLWFEIDSKQLILWGLLIGFSSLFRFQLATRYLNELTISPNPSRISLQKKEQHYALGSFFAGLSWAVLAWFVQVDWPVESFFLTAFLFAGLSAGALGTSISSLLNYIVFIIPIFAALILRLISYDFHTAAIVLSVYLIAAVLTAWKLNQLFVPRFEYKIENDLLIDKLSTEMQTQEALLIELKIADKFSKDAFDNSGVAMALVDENDFFVQVNKSFCELTGHFNTDMAGTSAFDLTHMDSLDVNKKHFQQLCAGTIPGYELRKRYTCANGDIIWVKIILSAIRHNNTFKHAVVHMQNVSQEHKLTQHLTYQAQHDFLTGLPNRYAFETTLTKVVDETELGNRQHILCYLDLDQFKVVNDSVGHLAGDELLRQITTLFQSKLRKTDILSRIGGDEFAILLFDCNLNQADNILQSLLTATRKFRFNWESQDFTIGVSIGLVAIEQNGLSPIELLKRADSACYAAKEAGRNRLHTFTEDDALVTQLSGEMKWIPRLQHALEEGELLIYQHQITPTNENDKRPHCELLVRLREKDGTIIYPDVFLPTAERYNLASKLDLWVVTEVLQRLEQAKNQKKKIAGIYGVNLSGASLGDADFQDNIISVVKQYDLPGVFICFEITETAAIENLTTVLKFIHALRELGCQFALDDFGTGLSSFAYLKEMPVDYLKIDGIFVKDCVEDRVNLSMIEAINDIGHVMGISTIAEFVEDEEIYRKLQSIGVDYVQGYWKGRPTLWHL